MINSLINGLPIRCTCWNSPWVEIGSGELRTVTAAREVVPYVANDRLLLARAMALPVNREHGDRDFEDDRIDVVTGYSVGCIVVRVIEHFVLPTGPRRLLSDGSAGNRRLLPSQ